MSGRGGTAQVEWSGVDVVLRNIAAYPAQVEKAAVGVGEFYAPQIEGDMKRDAPWTDRTSNARQGLWCRAIPLGDGVIAIHARHSVYYGIFLELSNQGRYAILLRTMERYYGPVIAMLKDVLS